MNSGTPLLYAAGLLAAPMLPACGELDQPTPIVQLARKPMSEQDAATMARLMRDIRSGFGERNPTLMSVSFTN